MKLRRLLRKADEDATIADPEERLRRFHQRDHVRVYGLDTVGRLADEGFVVEVLDDSLVSADLIEHQPLTWGTTRQVFPCTPSPSDGL